MGKRNRKGEQSGLSSSSITRRDFVGGTLIGAGAALLSMAAPSATHAGAPQTMPLPLTGLGPDWTGPGGIGDYAKSNGNTHEEVNAAHALRNAKFDKLFGSAPTTGETYDLVVVGCGFAGMSAAYSFLQERPDAKILMLDNHAVFGGEARQNEFEVDGHHLWAPQGSTGSVFPHDLGAVDPIWDEFGLPVEDIQFQEASGTSKDLKISPDVWTAMHPVWENADVGFFYEDHGFVKNPWASGFEGAPISEQLKRDYLLMELWREAPRRKDWKQWLDSMTYADFIKNVMGITSADEIIKFVNPLMASMGTGLGADVTSAYSAYEFVQPGVVQYARHLGDGDPTDKVYIISFPGGNAGLIRYFVKKLIPGAFSGDWSMSSILLKDRINWSELDKSNQPVRMRLSSTVVAVEHDGSPESAKHVWVTYYKNGELYRVKARTVACCGQQHINKHIVKDLPPEYDDAMSAFHHAPIATVNVAVRNWKFMEKAGITAARWFEGFGWFTCLRRQMMIDGTEPMPLDPNKPTVLTMFCPFSIPGLPLAQQAVAARMRLFGMSYKDIEKEVRNQFSKMFSPYGFNAERDIAGIIVNRQGHAYVTQPPGFYFGKDGEPAPREIIRKNYGRVAFAHAELRAAQMWGGAVGEGRRAAQQLSDVY